MSLTAYIFSMLQYLVVHWVNPANIASRVEIGPTLGIKIFHGLTYASFKYQFSCESYINSLNFRERQALCKLRPSAHTLEIERGIDT